MPPRSCPACRSVDLALGSPIDSFVITARECTAALGRDRRQRQPGVRTRLAVAKDAAAVELRMAGLRWMTWLVQMQAWLRHGGSGGSSCFGSLRRQLSLTLQTSYS